MDEEHKRRRRLLPSLSLPTLSLLIALLSMLSSITQSFNYRRNIESVQQNVLRTENLRTCREIIEVFFDFRLKAEETNARQVTDETATREMRVIVYRFGALGTYLANFAPELSRDRYARLAWLLNDIALKAGTMAKNDFESKFAEADHAFGILNEDCVRSAHFVRI